MWQIGPLSINGGDVLRIGFLLNSLHLNVFMLKTLLGIFKYHFKFNAEATMCKGALSFSQLC